MLKKMIFTIVATIAVASVAHADGDMRRGAYDRRGPAEDSGMYDGQYDDGGPSVPQITPRTPNAGPYRPVVSPEFRVPMAARVAGPAIFFNPYIDNDILAFDYRQGVVFNSPAALVGECVLHNKFPGVMAGTLSINGTAIGYYPRRAELNLRLAIYTYIEVLHICRSWRMENKPLY